jgi:hypothetical protein
VIEDGVVFQGNCQMGDVVEPPARRRSERGLGQGETEELEEAQTRY